MKTIKYMANDGWDISEEKMLKKLSNYASEGWILESMSFFRFKLIKKDPQDIIYQMDYQSKIEDKEEYRKIFEEAGWKFVCELEGFNIFYAPKGTVSIYTDKSNLIEATNRRKKYVFATWIVSLILALIGLKMKKSIISLIITVFFCSIFGYCSVWLFGLLRKNTKKDNFSL